MGDPFSPRVELLFRDAEANNPYRRDAVFAPDEQAQRRFHRGDLEGAGLAQVALGLELSAGRIDDRVQRGELRLNAELHSVGALIGKLQLIGCVDLDLAEVNRFHGRPGKAQGFRSVTARTFDALYIQTGCKGFGAVSQGDHALHRRGIRIDQHDAASN